MTAICALVASGVAHADGPDQSKATSLSADGCAGRSSPGSAGVSQIKQAPGVFDDFDGPAGAAPNPDKWTVSTGPEWDAGDQDYASGNATLDGRGHLAIRAEKANDAYVSGRVQTKGKANFGYGTLVARIKMPPGIGLWPAFFLVGADECSNPWPGAGEIDIVELASDSHTRYSSIHGPIAEVGDYLQDQISGAGPDLSKDFHYYWMTRSENAITIGLDDTAWGTFTPDSLPSSAEWVYNKPFYAVLNLAVGGDWAGQPDNSTTFPATMLVDYLHWEPRLGPN